MYLKGPCSPSTSAKIWGEVENCPPDPLFAPALQLLRVRLTMKCRALILPLQDAHIYTDSILIVMGHQCANVCAFS